MSDRDRQWAYDKALTLNEEIALTTPDEYWEPIAKSIKIRIQELRALKISIDNPIEVLKLLKAIQKSTSNFLFLINSPIDLSIPLPDGFIITPQNIFGKIHTSYGLVRLAELEGPWKGVLKEYSLALDLDMMKPNDNDYKWAWNFSIFFWLTICLISLVCCLMIFKFSGFWITTLGLVCLIPFWKIAKHLPLLIANNSIRNIAIIHNIYECYENWHSELEHEKTIALESFDRLRNAAISGKEVEAIRESVFLINQCEELEWLPQACQALDFEIEIKSDDTICAVLKLPAQERIEIRNKITPGGKVSVEEKTKKEMNEEYAIITMNMAYFFLTKVYSAYPSIKNIKLTCFTNRIDEGTGNRQEHLILYFDTRREDFHGIKFKNVNPIKLTERLGYKTNIDKSFYMEEISFEEESIKENDQDGSPTPDETDSSSQTANKSHSAHGPSNPILNVVPEKLQTTSRLIASLICICSLAIFFVANPSKRNSQTAELTQLESCTGPDCIEKWKLEANELVKKGLTEEGIKFFHRACDAGDVASCKNNILFSYQSGKISFDTFEADHKSRCDQGDFSACHNLVAIYSEVFHKTSDNNFAVKGVEMLKKACSSDFAEDCLRIAKGLEQSRDAEALKYYDLACRYGLPVACESKEGLLNKWDSIMCSYRLGLRNDRNGIVTDISKNSAAEQAGIVIGDELVSMYGESYLKWSGPEGKEGEQVPIVIRRNKKEIEINLVRRKFCEEKPVKE